MLSLSDNAATPVISLDPLRRSTSHNESRRNSAKHFALSWRRWRGRRRSPRRRSKTVQSFDVWWLRKFLQQGRSTNNCALEDLREENNQEPRLDTQLNMKRRRLARDVFFSHGILFQPSCLVSVPKVVVVVGACTGVTTIVSKVLPQPLPLGPSLFH